MKDLEVISPYLRNTFFKGEKKKDMIVNLVIKEGM